MRQVGLRQAVLGGVVVLVAVVAAWSSGPPELERDQGRERLLAETFDLARGHMQALRLPAADGQPVRVQVELDGQPQWLVLRPHSVRAPGFEVLERRANGALRPAAAGPSRTYRGQVAGWPGSRVAASIRGGQMQAFIMDGPFFWAVQPVPAPRPRGEGRWHVAYRSDDVLPGPWTCGTEGAPQPADPGRPDARAGIGACVTLTEIAFDADYEFYLFNGQSIPDTIADIEAVLNAVETIYATQLEIGYAVTTVIVQTDPAADPYTSTDPGALLGQFRSYWNANNDAVPRDVAHLMTGKELNGSIIGVAYLGSVCFLNLAYGLSQSHFTANFANRVILTAHELGHNWNAIHCNNDTDCGIMCSSVASCSGDPQTFGARSVGDMLAFRDSRDCIDPVGTALPQETKFIGDIPSNLDGLGISVAIDGDVAAAGAFEDDDAGINAGAVYVYRFADGGWTNEVKLTADDASGGDRFGVSVSLDGGVLAVGAYLANSPSGESGAVYLYRFVAGAWMQEAKIVPDDPAANDLFGIAVSVSGDNLVVGASGNDDVAGNAGAAYFFQRQGTTWVQQAKVTASDGALEARFGFAVDLETDPLVGATAVIGAWRDGELGPDAGAAYIYQLIDGVWTEDTKLRASDGEADDEFGIAVAIDGATVHVGARRDDDLGLDAGATYVYQLDSVSGLWLERAKITASDGAAGDLFGGAVSVESGLAVVGAHLDDDAGLDSGSAYVFQDSGDALTQISKITAFDAAPDGQFGFATSISAGSAIIGAWGADAGAINAGAAYIYLVGGPSGDCNGNGLADICDIQVFGTSQDCNGNGTPDECDISQGVSSDVDGNGIPDECDHDCNGNGIADSDDIASGTSQDCNGNGVPDECDVDPFDPDGDGQVSADINFNQVPDECEPDCNGNMIPDDVDILVGISTDCNGNGIPDECEIGSFIAESGELSPIYFGSPQLYPLVLPPLAESDVTVSVTANADLDGNGFFNNPLEVILLVLDGALIDQLFQYGAVQCPQDLGMPVSAAEVVIPADQFNLAISDGLALFGLLPSPDVGDWCTPSFVTVRVEYVAGDCNGDGVLDSCQMASGELPDVNGNGIPDVCESDCNNNGIPDDQDIINGTSQDVNGNGIPDECECLPDLNGDGVTDVLDMLQMLSRWGACPPPCPEDLNIDGVVDVLDLLMVLSGWGACP